MIYGVILAGGRGERFWPLSRSEHPKQLLKLTSDNTMIEETINRLEGFVARKQVLVVTASHLKEKILKAAPYLDEGNLLLEPQGRNTCLAIGLAAVHIARSDPQGVMVILSSDHLIHPREKLVSLLKAGSKVAEEGDHLITIGVVPTRAETAYGYIELGEEFDTVNGINFSKVKKFKEKPDPVRAQEYYLDRRHLWNSGMFVWRADSILKALEAHVPEMHRCLMAYSEAAIEGVALEALVKLYCDCASISIDFAVLEKATNVLTMRGDIKWDDLGSWLALDRIRDLDADNNVVVGKAFLEGSYENIVFNEDAGIIVGLGISDLVVVKTGDIVMVAHKTRVDEIKDLLSNMGRDEELEKYL